MKSLLTVILLCAMTGLLRAQGYYAEFTITSEKDTAVRGSLILYYQDGYSRSEWRMKDNGADTVLIYLAMKDNKSVVYALNASTRRYTEIPVAASDEWKDYPQTDYEVIMGGKAKVNGYKTKQVTVKIKGQDYVQELWLTPAIENYNELMKMKSPFTGRENFISALKASGAEGFPARIRIQNAKQTLRFDLLKVEARNNADELFSLKGYIKQSPIAGNPELRDELKKMREGMENMTPEERKKVAQEIKKKLGKE
ncbi:MAG: hypothetical protein KatS3mg031_0791 [Chitinophagales bacterium]|nr:MAG: hypothetical protein KatS3mg031_0791 [Chitinophagales bacterium]